MKKIILSKKQKVIAGVIAGLAVIFFVSAIVLLISIEPADENEAPIVNATDAQESVVMRRQIDGLPVMSEEEQDRYPVAIMIENAADSWPLSGLNKAQLVYEAYAESSITRFVALFASDEDIQMIGPVRSARQYYLELIAPYGALYLHVGGSPEALQTLRSSKNQFHNFDQFFNAAYYWRSTARYAPHNVYTSSELYNKALTDEELTATPSYTSWSYKDDVVSEDRPEDVPMVTIDYGAPTYLFGWEYDREDNTYIRYARGKKFLMSDGEEIRAKNIVVLKAPHRTVDEVGRKEIDLIGEGDALIFRDGVAVTGTWQKKSRADRETFIDADGNPIALNGGTTWMEIVPTLNKVTY